LNDRSKLTPRGIPTAGEDPRRAAEEDAALFLLFSLMASGQIKLRRIDSWQKIPSMLSQQTAAAA
jgi:hypothetical protein